MLRIIGFLAHSTWIITMSFSIAEHFARSHGGFDGLIKFTELINSGKDLDTIAEKLNLSTSQICRLREKLFEQIWQPKRGLVEYIEFQKHCLQREISRRDEYIKEKTELKLVIGGLTNEQTNN